jgi:hypothetical protein
VTRARSIGFLAALIALAGAAEAQAAVRYAAPNSTVTTGSCPAENPCQVQYAVGAADTATRW